MRRIPFRVRVVAYNLLCAPAVAWQIVMGWVLGIGVIQHFGCTQRAAIERLHDDDEAGA